LLVNILLAGGRTVRLNIVGLGVLPEESRKLQNSDFILGGWKKIRASPLNPLSD
jgi:hypothetical protein